jgi:hypothetical protein
MHLHLSHYFFLVVFFAFLAGAFFFAAMDSSPPFTRRKSTRYKKMHDTRGTGSRSFFVKIRRGHSCPRQSHSRDFKKSYFFLVAFFLVAFFFAAFFLAAIICPPPFGIPRF